MSELVLVKPSGDHADMVTDYRSEFFSAGESVINGGSLLEQIDDYDAWLELVSGNRNGIELARDWVKDSTFLAIRKADNRMVGIIRIAHELNDFLRKYAGHIGFSVRPSERNWGYATQMLEAGKDFCQELGIHNIMLGCYKSNSASQKVIIKCGGILEREQLYTDGVPMLVYWISLSD